MNRKIAATGISMFAVVGAILMFPGAIAMGGDPLDIKAYNILEDADNDIHTAAITTHGTIVSDGTDGAFGYGIFLASGDLLVSTTHGGFYDSETQTSFNPEPVWHNHIVALQADTSTHCAAPGLEVADLTFESPGVVKIVNDRVRITNVDSGSYNGQLFNTGLSQDGFDTNMGGQVVSFTLRPIDSAGNVELDAGEWAHVCVENVNIEQDTTPRTSQLTQTVGRP